MYYVYSTLANDMRYAKYRDQLPGQLGPATIEHEVLINGKVGVANKHLITPRGTVTAISDNDYEILKDNYSFKEHIKEGHILVEKKQEEVEKVILKMKKRDNSSPIVPDDYENTSEGAPAPSGLKRKRG
jgi:hypothetical protein